MIDRQMDKRQTDRQMDKRQTDRQMGRHTDRWTKREMD